MNGAWCFSLKLPGNWGFFEKKCRFLLLDKGFTNLNEHFCCTFLLGSSFFFNSTGLGRSVSNQFFQLYHHPTTKPHHEFSPFPPSDEGVKKTNAKTPRRFPSGIGHELLLGLNLLQSSILAGMGIHPPSSYQKVMGIFTYVNG